GSGLGAVGDFHHHDDGDGARDRAQTARGHSARDGNGDEYPDHFREEGRRYIYGRSAGETHRTGTTDSRFESGEGRQAAARAPGRFRGGVQTCGGGAGYSPTDSG